MTIYVNNNMYNYVCKIKQGNLRRSKMTFFAYVDRQKYLIRQRHEGETFLLDGKAEINIRDSEQILVEMSNLKGLNKSERLFYSQRRITRSPQRTVKR
jgi:hypothetical protein